MWWFGLTFSILPNYILKCPLKCAPASPSRCTLQWISQEPVLIERCFNFSFTLPATNGSFCSIRLELHWKIMFHKIWWLLWATTSLTVYFVMNWSSSVIYSTTSTVTEIYSWNLCKFAFMYTSALQDSTNSQLISLHAYQQENAVIIIIIFLIVGSCFVMLNLCVLHMQPTR